MSLEFTPLHWIYHDGWKFSEEKSLGKGSSSATWHQCGHCHFFMNGINGGEGTKAYWGEQKYQFHITDEWGPNSKDSIQNKSVRMLGKPIWYFHIDEYWRRIYIQPWDKVDMTCKLPLNQDITYIKINHVAWMEQKISSSEYYSRIYEEKYNEQKGITGRSMWFSSISPDRKKDSPENPDDEYIIKFIEENKCEQEVNTYFTANESIIINSMNTKKIMMDTLGSSAFPPNSTPGEDGMLLVSDGHPVGHTGIKYDASNGMHSLGPFREGGSFFFFSTAVNRALPCEYWLDEFRNERQCFIKKSEEGEETTGGMTWRPKSDGTHFTWVEDTFSETVPYIGEVNTDTWYEGYNGTITPHRRPYFGKTGSKTHCWIPMNAKRLKMDLNNDFAVPEKYDYAQNQFEMELNQNQMESLPSGKYPDDLNDSEGWVDIPGKEPEIPEMKIPDTWQKSSGRDRNWTGWYEWKEIIRCAWDGKWYRRKWKPFQYDIGAFSGDNPHWSEERRRNFPNPPPWLCVQGKDTECAGQEHEMNDGSAFIHMNNPYPSTEQNRLHMLITEYCMYYNLIRNQSGSPQDIWYVYNALDENGVAYQIFRSSEMTEEEMERRKAVPSEENPIPGTWDKAVEKWETQEQGAISSYEEEKNCFDDFISNLPEEKKPGHLKEKFIDGLMIVPEYGKTFVSLEEFSSVWEALSEDEIAKMKLGGDMPERNKTKYWTEGGTKNPPAFKDVYPLPTEEQINEELSKIESEEEKKKYLHFVEDEKEFKTEAYRKIIESLGGMNPISGLCSQFFPKSDTLVIKENERRGKQKPPLRPFPLSPMDETEKAKGMDLTDPYRNGTVNPIDTWKQYFTSRETFTIPEKTTVKGGGSGIATEENKNAPGSHPREMSFSYEDGARRTYPEKMFISPIIEYQKVTQLDWERLPGNEQDEQYIRTYWKTAQDPSWGDGFEKEITIPFRINGEIQSPFSKDGEKTMPPPYYFNPKVKPEEKMRYHAEFYDDPEQMYKYDFPNYLKFIREFQKRYNNYKENFDNHEGTLKYRNNSEAYDGPDYFSTWKEAIEDFWDEYDHRKENRKNPERWKFSNIPVTCDMDSNGEKRKINQFVETNTVNPATNEKDPKIWCENSASMFPEYDKFKFIKVNSEDFPGYIDSKGNNVKGADVVKFNNPYADNTDGTWIEQCLGAVVKAKCVMVMEDRFGYRWMETVEDTALQSSSPIRGMDYDAEIPDK